MVDAGSVYDGSGVVNRGLKEDCSGVVGDGCIWEGGSLVNGTSVQDNSGISDGDGSDVH